MFRVHAVNTRAAAAGSALALLVALAPATADAWQRAQTLGELCAEAGARPILRATLVRGQGRDGPSEAIVAAPCTITVTAGAVLRLADVHVSPTGRTYVALVIRLREGASLELRRARIEASALTIDGRASGGPVRISGASLGGPASGVAIITRSDVVLRDSSVGGLRGATVTSVDGLVALIDSSASGRDGVAIRAGPGGVRMTGGSAAGQAGVLMEARRGGSVAVAEARLSSATFALTPDAAGRSGAVVLVGATIDPAPAPDSPRVRFDLPEGAGCYTTDNTPEVVCPP